MESRTKAVVSFTILVVLLIGLYFFTQWFSLLTGYVLGEDQKIKLAQCLEGKNAVLYVSETCPDCLEQLDLFGESASSFLHVETCSTVEAGICSELAGFPAWHINNEFHYGVQELDRLVSVSGCAVS